MQALLAATVHGYPCPRARGVAEPRTPSRRRGHLVGRWRLELQTRWLRVSRGAITIDHDTTTSARNWGFVRIEVGGDRSCSVVIGSRLAAISAMLDLPRLHQIAKVVRGI